MLCSVFFAEAQNPGELDLTFGEAGLAILQPVSPSSMDNAQCAAVRPTGEIVFAGVSGGFSAFGMTVGQVLPDGSIDTAFGTDGVTVVESEGGSNFGYDIIVLPDGKLLVCGGVSLTPANTAMAVWRFDASGALDETFADNGALVVDVDESEDYALDILSDNAGQFTLIGKSKQPDNQLYRAAMIRFDESGSLVESFGISGTQVYPIETDTNCDVRAGVLAPTGEMYLAGYTTVSSTSQPILMGFNNDGEPLVDFGDAGIFDVGVEGRYFDIEFSNNLLIAVGDGNSGTSGVVRAHELSGELNADFGDAGTTIVSGGPANALIALAVQADGKIIAAGSVAVGFMMRDFLIARLLPDGSLDDAWGANGVTVTEVGPGFEDINDLVLQSDGMVIAAGFAQFNNNDYVFARYGTGELGEVMGCTDMNACNYNPIATMDDGSCFNPGDTCDDGDDETENDVYDENCDCVGEAVNTVESQVDYGFQMYPNPATDKVTLRFPCAGYRWVRLSSATGQLLMEVSSSTNTLVLPLDEIANGMYTLTVQTSGESFAGRVIVE